MHRGSPIPTGISSEVEEFLTGGHAAPSQSQRALRTVLFTDIVSSTERAAASGDERWRAVLQRFGEITAGAAERFDGTVVKSTGDGHLITFDGPTQAIRCAETLRDDAERLGIEIRIGIHTGECELLGDDIGGIAVHIAARILGQAGPGEIVVSRTVRDLVVGSGTGFEDRGSKSNCAVCPVCGNYWRSIVTVHKWVRRKHDWRRRLHLALEPRCAARIAPSR